MPRPLTLCVSTTPLYDVCVHTPPPAPAGGGWLSPALALYGSGTSAQLDVTKVTSTKVAGNAASAPEPEPGLTLLDPHLGELPPSEAHQGQNCPRRYERASNPTLFRPDSYLPPLSLCYRVLPTRGNIFMKE